MVLTQWDFNNRQLIVAYFKYTITFVATFSVIYEDFNLKGVMNVKMSMRLSIK